MLRSVLIAAAALALVMCGTRAYSIMLPSILPPCPPQQSTYGGVVDIGYIVDGFPGILATGNCNYGQLASVAGQMAVGTTGAYNLNPIGIADIQGPISGWESYQIQVNQGWLSASIVGNNLQVTVNAGAISASPGYYDGQITISGVDSQGFSVIASSWNLRIIVYSAAPSNLSAQLLDPVPNYIAGSSVSTNPAQLATDTQLVNGVAADGVTQLLLGINADNVGDQISITILNDQEPPVQSTNSQEDGGLANLGSAAPFTASQVTVSAVQAGSSAEAFALYLAPIDFARLNNGQAGSYKSGSCGNSGSTDDQLACRSVMLQIQDLTDGALTYAQVIILRPPLIMIHGLWDNWQAWNNFSPLVSGPGIVDPRFSVGRVNYDNPVTITASDPTYSAAQLQNASGNSLGFAYNASVIAGQIDGWITKFKAGENPEHVAFAAVQVDIVAHSMGGDIARTLVLQPNFVSGATYGQGIIHKVITIDTPHLGSPLASDLISSQEVGGCAESQLASKRMFVFNTALTANAGLVDGAMADLAISSPALLNIANKSPRPLLAAFIAGINPSFEIPGEITFCSVTGDSLAAADLTPSTWSAIFGGQPNDAIVAEVSQVNNLSGLQASSSTFVFSGVVHSPGSEHFRGLGFYPPSVLDPDSATGIPSTVIRLLNTPVTSSTFSLLNP